jgi:hypothetical protein
MTAATVDRGFTAVGLCSKRSFPGAPCFYQHFQQVLLSLPRLPQCRELLSWRTGSKIRIKTERVQM